MSEPATAPWTAASRSASSKTTKGALPPSSRCTRLTVSDAVCITRWPDGGGAGERDHRDVGVRDQVLTGDRPAPGDDVDDARRDAGVVGGLGEHHRGQRRHLSRLEHDRVSGGDRRQDLPRRHLQRVVPRSDRADDADRLAPDDRGVVAAVLAGGPALEVAGGAGEEGGVVDRAGHVELGRQPDRLAGLPALDLGELRRRGRRGSARRRRARPTGRRAWRSTTRGRRRPPPPRPRRRRQGWPG